MANWRGIERLLGETVREIGILVFVFAPLDAFFAEPPVDIPAVTLIVVSALGTIVAGVILEVGD